MRIGFAIYRRVESVAACTTTDMNLLGRFFRGQHEISGLDFSGKSKQLSYGVVRTTSWIRFLHLFTQIIAVSDTGKVQSRNPSNCHSVLQGDLSSEFVVIATPHNPNSIPACHWLSPFPLFSLRNQRTKC